MNKILLSLVAVFIVNAVSAQDGLEGIYVETYYVSDEADSLDADENFAVYPLGIGSVTYRVYVDMLPGYSFIQMFGNEEHPLTIQTTTAFYNDPNYGVSVYSGTSLNNTKKNTTLIDTYLTVGGVANGLLGVPKEEDTDGTIGNNQGILANSNPAAGQPIMGVDGVDGLLPGTPVLPNTLGISGDLDLFDQSEGNFFQTTNGTIAALGGAMGATETNHVLVGQFTTDGTLSFELNIQLLDPNGNDEIYVASNPGAGEFTNPTLTFESEPLPSSVSEIQQSGVQVYPNPTSDFLNIISKNGNIGKIEFIDATGRVVFSENANGSQMRIDTRDLSQGVYLVVFQNGENFTSSRFIKR